MALNYNLLMEKSLRGNIRAFRVYSGIQLLLGVTSWLVLFAYCPISKYFLLESPDYRNSGHSDINFFVSIILLLIFSIACLKLKILMASNYFISFDVSFAVVAFLVLGPSIGAGIAVLATIFDVAERALKSKKKRDYLYILFDNLGNRLLRFSFMVLAFSLLGGTLPIDGSLKTILVLFALYIVYFLANNIFYAPSEFFKGSSMKIYWEDTFKIDIFHTFLIFLISYYLSTIILRIGHGYAVLSALLILAAIFLISKLTRTEDELVKKVEELTILTGVSEAASSGLDLLPMVESFARKLSDALNAEGIGIVFRQPYSTTLFAVQVEAQKSRTKQLPTEERNYHYDQLPLSEPSSRLGSSLYEFLQPLETAPFIIPPAVYGVPLIYREEPIGGMVVYSSNARIDFARQNELLTTCAHSLVVGMENCFLHLQAIEDPLTGLYNRSYFLYRLQEELSYSSRHSSAFAIMMIDLDDFKVVNDHLGHQAGDEVLKKIGELFRFTLRREDVPARYGGDEFIILLLDCDEKNAYEKANRLRQLISLRALPKEKAQGLHIGCSISLISSDSLKGEYDIPSILKKLDDALYKAKAEGKNIIIEIE
jgi:diguanylate cyclase (GGDEF)-like protein